MQPCGDLLAGTRPASQGGLQLQQRAQRPWRGVIELGIRGHGHDSKDSLLARRVLNELLH